MYGDLTERNVVWWTSGHLREVVTHKWWSHREVRLFTYKVQHFEHPK